MIDTIHLRVQNLRSYSFLWANLLSSQKRKNSHTIAYINEETGEYIKDTPVYKSIFFHDTDNFLPVVTRDCFRVGSHHYSVSVKANFEENYADFNLSIPKLIFGTNLMQFVPLGSPMDVSSIYRKLLSFIPDFFLKYFSESVNLLDIDVERIDLCFNQYFNNITDLKNTIKSQQQSAHKYARSSKNKGRNYADETMMYNTADYSFKIYHKGPEFAKHDYKELQKNNSNNFSLGTLQRDADLCLRYEATFRKSFFRNIYKQKFFPIDSKLYSKSSQYFTNHYHEFLYNFNKIYEKNLFAKKGFDKFKILNDLFIFGSKRFALLSIFDLKKDVNDLLKADSFGFSEDLFKELSKWFWLKIRQYQIKESLPLDELVTRINTLKSVKTERKRLKVSNTHSPSLSRILMPALLSQFMSIEQLKGFYSQRTFARLRAEFKALGLSTNINQTVGSIPSPPLDYTEYFFRFGYYHNTWDF